MAEHSTKLEKRTCRICHKEQFEDNFPDYRWPLSRRGRLEGCNLCHENSKNRIFEALYEILSNPSRTLKDKYDYSNFDSIYIAVEHYQFIEKIQHISKSIANHYFFQITQHGEDEFERDNGPDDWKDEFLYTLEVYQRLHYAIDAVAEGDGSAHDVERNLKYLIMYSLPKVERRKTPESEPVLTHHL